MLSAKSVPEELQSLVRVLTQDIDYLFGHFACRQKQSITIIIEVIRDPIHKVGRRTDLVVFELAQIRIVHLKLRG